MNDEFSFDAAAAFREEGGNNENNHRSNRSTSLSKKICMISFLILVISVGYNISFIVVMSQIEPAFLGMAIYEGSIHIIGSMCLAFLGLYALKNKLAAKRQQRQEEPIVARKSRYLHIFYVFNCGCGVFVIMLLGLALSSFFASVASPSSQLMVIQMTRMAFLFVETVLYFSAALLTKLLYMHEDYSINDNLDSIPLVGNNCVENQM